VIRYVLNINNLVFFLPILITGVMLHSLIIYLISYYYVEKVLHLSEDTQHIKNAMIYLLVAFVVIYLAIWIYDLKNYATIQMAQLCTTFIYVVPATLNCIISCGTVAIGFFVHSKL